MPIMPTETRKWLGLGVLALSLAGGHYIYKCWPPDTFHWTAAAMASRARAWAQWRFLGAQGAILYAGLWWAYRASPERLWRHCLALVCGWGCFQQAELVGCSFGIADQPNALGLCTAQYGRWFNMLVAAGAFAALGVSYVRGSENGSVRSWYVRCVAPCRALGAVTWTAVVRAYQAIKGFFRSGR